MENILQFLGDIHPLSPQLFEYLYQNIKTCRIRKKEFLLNQGQVSKHIYFVQEGLLRCFYLMEGKEVCSWFMKENDVVISVESFFNQNNSYESIQAIEDCTVQYLTYDDLEFMYANFLEFNFISRIITQHYYTLSEQRLYAMRMQKAQDKYDFLMQNHADLILRVPAKYLASYLGVTEVTFSNMKGIRNELKNGQSAENVI